MGIFDRLRELARANMTPLDHELDLGPVDPLLASSIDEVDVPPASGVSPEILAGWYALLELPRDADRYAVRSSYRRLLVRFHPDKFANDPEKQRLATELTRRLNVAYQGLLAHLSADP